MENEVTTTSDITRTPKSMKRWIASMFITTSQTVVGQTLFRLLDSFLWVIEKSAQWSLPAQEIEAEDDGKVFGKLKLTRPLPWFLFLPGLAILRIIRCIINVGAYIFGYPQIQPSGMVKSMQRSRRRLRALNLKIAKSLRRSPISKDKRLTMIEAKKALIRSIRLTLSTLSCLDTSKSSPSPPPTKIRISHTDLEPVATPDEKSTTESVDSPIHHEAKRKFSQLISDEENSDESDNERLHLKLERLALEDSADDLDFNLATCSTGINTASSSVSSDEADKDVSITEVRDIQREANEYIQKMSSLTATETVLQTLSLEKLEDNPDGEKYGVDSSESEYQKPTCGSKEFIDHEISSTLKQLSIDETPLLGETNQVESQKEPATCELPPAQESCKLPPSQESCELPPSQESCELPPPQESCELPPSQESCELPPAQQSCELPPSQESCELPPAQQSCELPPSQESCELPPAQQSCELPLASKFRELPSVLKFCELPPASECRELLPAPGSHTLPPAQESCELPSTADTCESLPECCELLPMPKSCELSPIPQSYELPPTPESCELPSAPESCELPLLPESCELPPSQIPCKLTSASKTCTSEEGRTLDAKEFPIEQEKKDCIPKNLEHHRDTN
ncbi:paternally-expressed gene 3 protein-like isoform X1 [Bombus affinis]|uniref:paternally-expressed gene 3 protein-like isoform X1 n=1 Tax=Bombus affinis TaxID=309941 RepID=UPI0021B74011|nr:paternally-expressed gene 3 protein-like isoform X1 [Bombus affinis]XP_050586646.1 paternally-expressed gene 3 protein-like isoform X1 [Bombus affinis]XP_050586647.1 paternally-expressed gene 3 protein-like isoform X1 [Bombus affinis]XP_050586650.1 paternally-expressed gene 3 protein-like isoform X1 [Bombus affinis]